MFLYKNESNWADITLLSQPVIAFVIYYKIFCSCLGLLTINRNIQ